MPEKVVSEEFVRQSERFLVQDLLPKIRTAVSLLSEEEVWWRPNAQSNSVGNILLHLIGNVEQWILSGVGQAPDRRLRDQEFLEQGPIPVEKLMERLQRTVDNAVEVIRKMDRARLLDKERIQVYEVTLVQAIYHVVEHFSYHTGQIVYVAKMLKGVDTKFYDL